MALDTYANFKAAIADHLIRTDLTTQIVDCITLFEAEAANELFKSQIGSGQSRLVILHPNQTDAVNITGTADNGSGLIRLTVDSTTSFVGDPVNVADVGGTTEANGEWSVTVISSTTMDLQDSVFVNTYTSGGTAQNQQGYIILPTDYLAWQRVTSTGTPKRELTYVHPTIFAAETSLFFAPVQNQAPIFTIEGAYLYATPGISIEFLYFVKTAALSGSLNWLFTNRVDAYWNGTLEQIYRYTKDYEQATVYQQAKGAIFDQIKKHQLREAGALAIRIQGSSYGATP